MTGREEIQEDRTGSRQKGDRNKLTGRIVKAKTRQGGTDRRQENREDREGEKETETTLTGDEGKREMRDWRRKKR